MKSTQKRDEHNTELGMGLTLRELCKTYEDMRLYIAVKSPESAKLAKMVDTRWPGRESFVESLNFETQRRYGSGHFHDSFEHHERWLDYIHDHYIRWAKDHKHLIDRRLSRCFNYCGLGKEISARAPNHWHHRAKVSPVLGLFTAVLERRYPGKFDVKEYTYQVFRTIDQDDIGFDEKLTTILTSGYPWDGGLSTAYTGINKGTGPNDESTAYLDKLDENGRKIEASGNLDLHVKDIQDKAQKCHQAFVQNPDNETKYREMYERNVKASEDLLEDIRKKKLVISYRQLCDDLEQA